VSKLWGPPIFEEEIQKARECQAIILVIRQLADQQFADEFRIQADKRSFYLIYR